MVVAVQPCLSFSSTPLSNRSSPTGSRSLALTGRWLPPLKFPLSAGSISRPGISATRYHLSFSRCTVWLLTASHQDIDVVAKSGPAIDRFKIRDQIAASDRRFTVNLEKICGLTFRERAEDPVTPMDIIDEKVVSPNPCSSSSSLVVDMPYA